MCLYQAKYGTCELPNDLEREQTEYKACLRRFFSDFFLLNSLQIVIDK